MRTLAGWLVLIALASLTLARLPDWEIETALWRSATRTAPRSVRAWANRRNAAIATGDWTTAVDACVRLRTLTPATAFESRLIQQACGSF